MCFRSTQYPLFGGYVVSEEGVSTDPSKIADVNNWPVSNNLKELRGFLGLSGYHRKFVRYYGMINQPLTNLLRKHPFVWSPKAESAFEQLKLALTTAPVLSLPDFSQQFVIETDACDTGVGAVLLQKGHPIAYMSKGFTYEKEYMAVLLAVEQWRTYLQHAEFLILTDHSSLAHLEDQQLHTTWQQKVFTKLLGLQFKIKYKKGVDNRAANALSRKPHLDDQLLAISSHQPTWIQEILDVYQENTEAQELLVKLAVQISEDSFFSQGWFDPL